MVTASNYYHTYAWSVIGTLSAAPVDTIDRISIIFFLTVLPKSLYANLCLTLIYCLYFRPLVHTLRCGPTVGALRSSFAPLSSTPQERVCSTTTFTTHTLRITGLEAVTKSPNKNYCHVNLTSKGFATDFLIVQNCVVCINMFLRELLTPKSSSDPTKEIACFGYVLSYLGEIAIKNS